MTRQLLPRCPSCGWILADHNADRCRGRSCRVEVARRELLPHTTGGAEVEVMDGGPVIRLGAVLEFAPGVSSGLAEALLEQFKDWGVIDSVPEVHLYNREDGGPVWYIP